MNFFMNTIFLRRSKIWLAGLIIVLISFLFSAGCSAFSVPEIKPTELPREPFSARAESEDGTIVEWSGFVNGYRAGEPAEFEISIQNNSEQNWKGRLCLNLIGGKAAPTIFTLHQREFNLQPGMGFSDTLSARLPEDLSEGSYGLSTVVRRPAGPLVDVVNIQIGTGNMESQEYTQQDMDAALDSCPPLDPSAQLVAQARAQLAQKLGVELEEISVQQVESTEFKDASLGVPEEGQMYAQVITPGYVIDLSAQGDTYRFNASENRVVFVPEESTSLPERDMLILPEDGARVTLPLHILARIPSKVEEVKAVLRWEDGTELSKRFATYQISENSRILIGSLDWVMEGQPPEPDTSRAALTLENSSGEVLTGRDLAVLQGGLPDTELIDLYWLLGETLESEQRWVVKGERSTPELALEELLWGPPPRNLAGFQTSLPDPEEVLNYPGRQQDWGFRVELLDLTIENGTATANFSREMQAYGGGSSRVLAIREQITRTLTQFESVGDVIIAVEGETESALQP
jgi:hypothetical protein